MWSCHQIPKKAFSDWQLTREKNVLLYITIPLVAPADAWHTYIRSCRDNSTSNWSFYNLIWQNVVLSIPIAQCSSQKLLKQFGERELSFLHSNRETTLKGFFSSVRQVVKKHRWDVQIGLIDHEMTFLLKLCIFWLALKMCVSQSVFKWTKSCIQDPNVP